MKILIPVLGFDRAGGYRVLSKLADELISLGNEVRFLSPGGSEPPYYPTRATIMWIDANGSLSTQNEKSGRKNNAFSIQKKLTKALRKIPTGSYDVIIANHALTTLPVKRAGLVRKTLYYVQAYEPEYYDSGSIKDRILAFLSEKSYKMKLFTVVNGSTYLNYKKLKATKILYPGIDTNIFYQKSRKLNQRIEDKIVIGTIGRTEDYKGTRYITQAFLKLNQKYSNFELHVAFGDPRQFKDHDNIYCFQPHGDEKLARFYRSLDYYICAGYIQLGAFHYPVSEAMSCAVPVITTAYYPANDANAWMIKKTQDPEEIVTLIELAQSNPSLKQKKLEQALSDVKQFDWKRAGEQLNNYIKELVQGPPND